MEISLRVKYIVTVDKKYEVYMNISVKDGYVTVFCLVSSCPNKVSWTLMVSYFMQN